MPPQPRHPEPDRLLRFAQAMNILRSDDTITRADARAWINREYPNAQLVLGDDLADAPLTPEEREQRAIAEVPDGGLERVEPYAPSTEE